MKEIFLIKIYLTNQMFLVFARNIVEAPELLPSNVRHVSMGIEEITNEKWAEQLISTASELACDAVELAPDLLMSVLKVK